MLLPKSLLLTTLSLISLTTATDLSTRQNDPDIPFRISKFHQECHAGRCSYQMQINADGTNSIPYGFMASCSARDMPRGDTTLRNCSVNRGDKIQSVKAFLEQRPLRPNRQTKLVIEVGVNEGGGRVSYWRAEKMDDWYGWQAYGVAGEFEIYAHQFAAVA